MGPKKDDKKKGQTTALVGAIQTITEDELNDAKNLPELKDFVFFNLYACKSTRNQARLQKQVLKQFQYINAEDPGYTEELSQKFKTIELNQLYAQAIARGLMTEDDIAKMGTFDVSKRREILAQVSVESVTAFQLAQRKTKKPDGEEEEAKEVSPADEVVGLDAMTPSPDKQYKVEQVLLLQDFPKTCKDVEAMIKHGLKNINGAFLIEEIFSREMEDEDDDDTKVDTLKPKDEVVAPVEEPAEGEEKPVVPEKLKNRLSERAAVFEELFQINRLLKKQPSGSVLRSCIVERLKFKGPVDPMDLPVPPEDGSEPPPIDEERKGKEFKFYDDFALEMKNMVTSAASDLQQFKGEYATSQQNLKQLWPVPIDPDEERRRAMEAELRQSQLEAKKKLEEERLALEAANSKGKKSNQKGRAPTTMSADPVEGEAEEEVTQEVEEEPILLSLDDDKTKQFDFFQYQKAMGEISTGSCSVGSILGAMVYQIDQSAQLKLKAAVDQDQYPNHKGSMGRKVSSRQLRKQSTQLLQAEKAQDEEMFAVFGEAIEALKIEHSIKETDYKHEFSANTTLPDKNQTNSPYMIVKDQNDKMRTDQDKNAYHFLNGLAQDQTECNTLSNMRLPGVNNRQGMPEKATLSIAERESNRDQIVRFCKLPASQTERCLILDAFERMMHKNLPERQFSFLDRNYTEEYKDPKTVRQILSMVKNSQRPDILSEYYEMDDGLLVSLFFKNPPGRLLRRQWSNPVRSFPDFADWRSLVKQGGTKIDSENMLDVKNDRVGVIRNNTKFSFPSDNSVIRTDKYYVGQRRMGESQIIKDNFVFGISETKQAFNEKVQGEDGLRNRDAKQLADKRCDFNLTFENGVRLSIQMQEHLEATMDLIPPSDIPKWLKAKMDREIKLQKELDEMSSRKAVSNIGDGEDAGQGSVIAPGDILSHDGDASKLTNEEKNATQMNTTKQSMLSKRGDSKEQQRETVQTNKDQVAAPEDNKQDEQLPEEEKIVEEDDPETKDPSFTVDGKDMTVGAKLTFTFNEGLIVQIQPNGDVLQKHILPNPMGKAQTKGNTLTSSQPTEAQVELHRVITTEGEIIKHMADGNLIIYQEDGTLTYSDKRRGLWYTINPHGVKRVRKVKGRIVSDEMKKLKIDTKIDPETNATLKIREDGVLSVTYEDESKLIVMPDGTNILKKKRADGEAGTITFITKQNFVPIRQIYDPVKARAGTVIGLGGTDALMGKDLLMERTNTGKISELLLPDQTIVQSYLEKQELEGYNRYSTNMIHIIRRDDFSVVKVKQDGEVVLITGNERAYLNDIGKQIEEFGTKDYDFFFELFGVPAERRSGVYTANLDMGRVWTQDEEGNYFIVYANGDAVEKMSVSFDLDQMVEGIENKEPSSPRIKDGEFIEDECKFLPPPKSMADPRLLYIKNDGSGIEFFNEEQLTHMFRTYRNHGADKDLIQTSNHVKCQNQDSISHVFLARRHKDFDPEAFNIAAEFPKLPQTLELVNQTVSIPSEPVVEQFTFKNVIEYPRLDDEMMEEFRNAQNKYDQFRAKQEKVVKDLTIRAPDVITQALPPAADKDGRMRSTSGMQSTMMMSQMSPRSDQKSAQTFNKSTSERSSPRLNRAATKAALLADQQKAVEDALKTKVDEEAAQLRQLREIDVDESTGMQVFKNELEHKLSFMQKLQLRIAKERKIEIQGLKGEEFQILKQYKKLEQRQMAMNNMTDFFDPSYAYDPNMDHHEGNILVAGMNAMDSRQQILSQNGEQLYSEGSMPEQRAQQRDGYDLLPIHN